MGRRQRDMTATRQLSRDGSIDNQIVAHEYGHYVSTA
jgi:hypothetical protein